MCIGVACCNCATLSFASYGSPKLGISIWTFGGEQQIYLTSFWHLYQIQCLQAYSPVEKTHTVNCNISLNIHSSNKINEPVFCFTETGSTPHQWKWNKIKYAVHIWMWFTHSWHAVSIALHFILQNLGSTGSYARTSFVNFPLRVFLYINTCTSN